MALMLNRDGPIRNGIFDWSKKPAEHSRCRLPEELALKECLSLEGKVLDVRGN